jgi:predicted RNA-binding protein with RPS1 domain
LDGLNVFDLYTEHFGNKRPRCIGNVVCEAGQKLLSDPVFANNNSVGNTFVGFENHSAGKHLRHKVGVWADGRISWLDESGWDIQLDIATQALVGNSTARNEELGILLEMTDFVDVDMSALIRKFHIVNLRETKRDIRIFMHQAFVIGDTRSNTDTVTKVGERIKCEIIAIDPKERKISLSVKAMKRREEKEAMESYSSSAAPRSSIADTLDPEVAARLGLIKNKTPGEA